MIKTKQKKTAGFTLIELLVVIAIIGILSAIVLVVLNNPRTSAKDKAIIAEINFMRSAAEMYYADNSTYNSFCGSDCTSGSDSWQRACASMVDKEGTPLCEDIDSAFCAQVSLPGGGSHCVDNSGYSGATSSCDVGNATCAND